MVARRRGNVTPRRYPETIQPSLGASTFRLSQTAVKSPPGGDNVPLSQVILQAPGVAVSGSARRNGALAAVSSSA